MFVDDSGIVLGTYRERIWKWSDIEYEFRYKGYDVEVSIPFFPLSCHSTKNTHAISQKPKPLSSISLSLHNSNYTPTQTHTQHLQIYLHDNENISPRPPKRSSPVAIFHASIFKGKPFFQLEACEEIEERGQDEWVFLVLASLYTEIKAQRQS